MHPDIVRALAATRIADLRRAALRWQVVAERPPGRTRHLGRRMAAVIAECLRAQHRAMVLAASLDRHLPQPHTPPADYREFLARTAGPLLREPPASARSRGHTVY